MITDEFMKLVAACRSESASGEPEVSTSTWEPPGSGGKVQTDMIHTWRWEGTPVMPADYIPDQAKGDDTMAQADDLADHDKRVRAAVEEVAERIRAADRIKATEDQAYVAADPWKRFASLDDDEFHDALSDVLNDMHVLLSSKRESYGPNNLTTFGDVGVLVRASDKMERLAHMYRNGTMATAYDLMALDAWRDLCGYSLLMLVAHDLEDDE